MIWITTFDHEALFPNFSPPKELVLLSPNVTSSKHDKNSNRQQLVLLLRSWDLGRLANLPSISELVGVRVRILGNSRQSDPGSMTPELEFKSPSCPPLNGTLF